MREKHNWRPLYGLITVVAAIAVIALMYRAYGMLMEEWFSMIELI